jgi:hypothetical protein
MCSFGGRWVRELAEDMYFQHCDDGFCGDVERRCVRLHAHRSPAGVSGRVDTPSLTHTLWTLTGIT